MGCVEHYFCNFENVLSDKYLNSLLLQFKYVGSHIVCSSNFNCINSNTKCTSNGKISKNNNLELLIVLYADDNKEILL